MGSIRPDPSTITRSSFAQLLKLYQEVQEATYRAKVKDPKKLATAQQSHDWRYDELPEIVAKRSAKKSSPTYLDKEELVRLTQWKIVHGQHRPFLPGMVKKNDPGRVKEVTSSAYEIQAGASYVGGDVPESLNKALREAALLNGIGPATATLVCSIYDPTNVSFFEDELMAWLCPDIAKLKYTWAEYNLLFAEISKLRERLGPEHKAVDVEKVGFVVGHFDVLDEKQREVLTAAYEMESSDKHGTENVAKPSVAATDSSDRNGRTSKPSTAKISKTKRKGKAEEDTIVKQSEAEPKAKRRRK